MGTAEGTASDGQPSPGTDSNDDSPGDNTGDDSPGDDSPGDDSTGTVPAPEGPGIPMMGSCGWDGETFACGYENEGPLCPDDVVAGEQCESALPCCTAGGEVAYCTCDDNACDTVWTLVDCEFSTNAGACGWSATTGSYTCGGQGADPGGAEMACADTAAGDPCDDTPGAACCDEAGDAKECTLAPNGGGWQWGWPTDCVLD